MFVDVRESLYSRQGKSKLNILLNVLIVIILLAILAELIFGSLYKGIYIVQSSMRPTIIGATADDKYGGDYVYVKPGGKPDYGDIVVVYKSEQTTIIKRVIAFGGDRVKLDKGQLSVMYKGASEWEIIDEYYVDKENNNANNLKNTYPRADGHLEEEGHLVADNCMFLLGDNRNVSVDSRDTGDVPLKNLYGIVTDWSIKYKTTISALHKFFKYDVPAFFGVDVKIQGIDY